MAGVLAVSNRTRKTERIAPCGAPLQTMRKRPLSGAPLNRKIEQQLREVTLARLWAHLCDEFHAAGATTAEARTRHARRAVALVRRDRDPELRTFAPGDGIPYDVTRVYDLDGDVWERQEQPPGSLKDTWKMPGFNPAEHEGAAGGCYITPHLLDEYGPLTEMPEAAAPILAEAWKPKPRARTPKREVLPRCQWCFKHNRTASEWEQQNLKGVWHRLCVRCANRRLGNPWNALLSMRKIGSEEKGGEHA